MLKNAIALLTRGYKTLKEYDLLIERNRAIEIHMNDKYKESIDFLVFHEGNITKEQQIYIQGETPKISLTFVNIETSFRKILDVQVHPPTQRFPLSYRNMCNFWFCEFWNYVEKYHKLIRIDEDCIMKSNPFEMLEQLNEKVCVYGHWSHDDTFVTCFLNEFTMNFLKKKGYNHVEPRTPGGPYTNVFGINLQYLHNTPYVQQYKNEIQKSNNIYIYRWGDLPLWGEIFRYFFDKEHSTLLSDKIQYYHGSHKIKVNC